MYNQNKNADSIANLMDVIVKTPDINEKLVKLNKAKEHIIKAAYSLNKLNKISEANFLIELSEKL